MEEQSYTLPAGVGAFFSILSRAVIQVSLWDRTALVCCLQPFFRDKDSRHLIHSHDTTDSRV